MAVMTPRRALRRMRELELLQRVERDVAAVDVGEAQAREAAAVEVAERDAERVLALARTWDAAISSDRLLPERVAAIGAALLEADTTAGKAALVAQDLASVREARTVCWRRLDATLRATGDVVGGLSRDAARLDEEAALAAVAERATFDWRRR
jgi:hypothetical protein